MMSLKFALIAAVSATLLLGACGDGESGTGQVADRKDDQSADGAVTPPADDAVSAESHVQTEDGELDSAVEIKIEKN